MSNIHEAMNYINGGNTLTMDDIREISEYGTASSCKPSGAIYYHMAANVMAKYGDLIVEFLDMEIPGINMTTSYQGWCCDVVSMATELYCQLRMDQEYEYDMDEPSELTEWQDYDSDC